jgi:hypothetical protein
MGRNKYGNIFENKNNTWSRSGVSFTIKASVKKQQQKKKTKRSRNKEIPQMRR